MRTALAALLCTVATSALALDEPVAVRYDPHVKTEAYNPYNRTLLIATVGRVTNITVSPLERIYRVVTPVDDGPVITPNPHSDTTQPLLNNLFLRGAKVGSEDVLLITLLPDNTERTYQMFFKVREGPRDGSDDPEATYGLTYTYLEQEKAAAQQKTVVDWKAKREAEKKAVAEGRLATDIFYGVRNWHYVAQGTDTALAPYEASDNGRSTVFRYPGNTEMPTVYVVDGSGAEHTVRTDAKNDLLVVWTTAEHFRLRLGRRVLEVFNRAYDPVGQNPGTGTGDPGVIRRVVSTQ